MHFWNELDHIKYWVNEQSVGSTFVLTIVIALCLYIFLQVRSVKDLVVSLTRPWTD